MINKEKLQEYKEKYNPLKERIFHSVVAKEDLERQEKKARQNVRKLDSKIIEKQAKMRLDIMHLREKLKKRYKKNFFLGLGASLFLGLFCVYTFPVAQDLSIIDYILKYGSGLLIFDMACGIAYKTYRNNIHNLPTFTDEDIKTPEVDKLIEERDLAIDKEKEISTTLKIVKDYLTNLKETKVELENLIWCLFYPEDLIDDRKTTPLGLDKWLEINTEEEKVEVGPLLIRENPYNKKKGR